MSVSEESGSIWVSPRVAARAILGLGVGIGAVLLAAGFLGRFHPALDTLAVFRGALIGATLVASAGLAVIGAKRAARWSIAVPLLAGMSLLPHWFGNGAAGDLVVYQKNLWWLNPTPEDTRVEIEGTGADIVTLQEVSVENDFILPLLEATYPHQVRCPFRRVGGVAILSRFPIVAGSEICVPRRGFVAATLDTPSGPVTAVSIHLHWPWPHSQPRQVAQMLPDLRNIEGPVVVGGDFNMVRWSHTVRQIAEATGTAPVGSSKVTFPLARAPGAGLSIDNVLATGGAGRTELGPLSGSDHRGVLARVALEPGAQ